MMKIANRIREIVENKMIELTTKKLEIVIEDDCYDGDLYPCFWR